MSPAPPSTAARLTDIPARLDALAWSPFHTRVVVALGITWILDGLEVTLAGAVVPWWVVVLAIGLVAAALAYATGIMGVRRLGSKLASFVGLSEVLFAVAWAWLLLGEAPAPVQLAGGVLVLAGVFVVRLDEEPKGEAGTVPVEALGTPGD